MTIREITIALIAPTSRIILARSQWLHRLCDAQAPKYNSWTQTPRRYCQSLGKKVRGGRSLKTND